MSGFERYTVTQPPTSGEVSAAIGDDAGVFDVDNLRVVSVELTRAHEHSDAAHPLIPIIASIAIESMRTGKVVNTYVGTVVEDDGALVTVTVLRQPLDTTPARVTILHPPDQPHTLSSHN